VDELVKGEDSIGLDAKHLANNILKLVLVDFTLDVLLNVVQGSGVVLAKR